MKRDNGRVNQQCDFVRAQHFGQAIHSFWIWSVRRVPGSAQSLYEEETQCSQTLVDGVGGEFSVSEQVSLENREYAPDLICPEGT